MSNRAFSKLYYSFILFSILLHLKCIKEGPIVSQQAKENVDLPKCEDLVKPSGLSIDNHDTLTPTFRWNKVENAIFYKFQLVEKNSNLIIYTEENIGIENYTLHYEILNGVEYIAKVASTKTDCAEMWSDEISFTINIEEPFDCNNLSAPSDIAVLNTNTLTPIIKWQSVQNAELYRIRVEDIYDNYRAIYSFDVKSDVTETTILSDSILNLNEYRAYVGAYKSDCSEKYEYIDFVIQIPELYDPCSELTATANIEFDSTSDPSMPTIIWQKVDLADYYRIYLVDDTATLVSDYSTLNNDETEYTITNGILNPDIQYNVYIASIIRSCNAKPENSSIYKYEEDADTNCANIATPTNLHISNIDGVNPTISWDKISYADGYLISLVTEEEYNSTGSRISYNLDNPDQTDYKIMENTLSWTNIYYVNVSAYLDVCNVNDNKWSEPLLIDCGMDGYYKNGRLIITTVCDDYDE